LWQWADQHLTTNEVERLKELEQSIANSSEDLLALITENELLALKARIIRLLAEGTFPTPSEDWPAVPWPPF
jgi:hypothetical protein